MLQANKTYLGYVSSIRSQGELAVVNVFAIKSGNSFSILPQEEAVFARKKGKYEINQLYEMAAISENKFPNDGSGFRTAWCSLNVLPTSRIPIFTYNRKAAYIDLEEVLGIPELQTEGNISKFVLQDEQNPSLFYGYFRKANNSVIPIIHKHVHAFVDLEWRYNSFELKNGRRFLLVSDLGDSKQRIDCATNAQLVSWFKGLVQTCSGLSEADVSSFQKVVNAISIFDSDLDKVRFERITKNIEGLYPDFDFLKTALSNKESPLFIKLNQDLEQYKQNQKKLWQAEALKEITSLKNEVETYRQKITEAKRSLTETKDELSFLEQNKESILATLKVALPILNVSNAPQKETVKNITPIVFGSTSQKQLIFKDHKDTSLLLCTAKNLKKRIHSDDLNKVVRKMETLLFSSRACFIPSVSWAYAFGLMVQNSKMWIMHVEHDWLHYNDFCSNGLLNIWNYAAEHLDENCILVLDSINLTQPECGLKPLLDVVSGKSPILQNTSKPIPANLKIFATVVPASDEHCPGLKLQAQSFEKWGFFLTPEEPLHPKFEPNFLEIDESLQYVSVEALSAALNVREIDDNKSYFEY